VSDFNFSIYHEKNGAKHEKKATHPIPFYPTFMELSTKVGFLNRYLPYRIVKKMNLMLQNYMYNDCQNKYDVIIGILWMKEITYGSIFSRKIHHDRKI
jgi:hypothetical protein